MFRTNRYFKGIVATVAIGAVCAGCESAGLDSSLLDTNITGVFAGKPAPEPELQEHGPLVMPPANAALPVPGQRSQAAAPNQAVAANNAKSPTDAGATKAQTAKSNANDQRADGSASDQPGSSWIYRMLHPDEQKKTQ